MIQKDKVIELIKENLNKDGKLDCTAAFKVAAKARVLIDEVGEIANEIGVKIDNCELGQFGSLEFGDSDVMLYEEKLKPLLDEKGRISCTHARALAGGVGLKKIRSILSDYNVDVKYCRLGCFKEKKRKKMSVKTKTWIEGADGELLFGKGKTEILDVISQVGSIKRASEILNMNYKKCWTHLKILQENLKEDLFVTKQGGGMDAGTTLKPRAFELIRAYKQLQRDIESYANKRFKELFIDKEEK
ncbi:MAG: LysR family transcriptional regulator [Campylobacter sp.]|nr:LysR family transcriptional regulator [Campylobacter sp.]